MDGAGLGGVQVAEGIHKIDGVRGANAYLVLSPEGAVVVDTGLPGNEARIAEYLKKAGVDKPLWIVLTHPDIDHSGSAAKLKALTGAKVAIHAADAPRLAGEMKLKEVKGAAGLLLSVMSPFIRFTPVKADVLLNGGETMSGLTVVHTPGHTAGSVCLYKDGVAMFVGDALRTDSEGKPGLSSASMTADMEKAKESAKKIAGYRYELLLPGHGPPITKDASKAMAKFVQSSL